MARVASMSRRVGWYTHHGTRLAEAISAMGMAVITARAVPQRAICSVTTISSTYIRHWLKLGGKKSAT